MRIIFPDTISPPFLKRVPEDVCIMVTPGIGSHLFYSKRWETCCKTSTAFSPHINPYVFEDTQETLLQKENHILSCSGVYKVTSPVHVFVRKIHKRGLSSFQVLNAPRNHKMINFSYFIKYILYVLCRTEHLSCLAVFPSG